MVWFTGGKMLSPVGIRLKLKKAITCIFLAYLFFSCKVHAIGFGDITLYSYLNEPLSAEIELANLNGIDLRSLHVDIASAEDFMLAGVTQFFSLHKLKFEVITVKDKSVVYIWTNDVIQDPFIEFLLKLEWAGGKIVKGFTILLDPPGTREQTIKKGKPLVLSDEYQRSMQNTSVSSEIKGNFPYDEKLAKKLNIAATGQQQQIVTMPAANGLAQNTSINTSLTKNGDSLKDLADGFEVPASEILTPEGLKNINPVKEKILLNSIAQTVKQAKVPEVIQVVIPPKPVEVVPTLAEPPKPIEPPTPAAAPQSLSSAPSVVLQQIPMQAVPDIKTTAVVEEQDIKVVTNISQPQPQPQLQAKEKPNFSNLLDINERQVANTVIHKYKLELIFTFLLVVVSLLFIVKIIRQRQINKVIDDANDDMDEALQDVVADPVTVVADQVRSEVITKERDISEPMLAETIARNVIVEDIEIPDVLSTREETSSVVNVEVAIRLNLATQYIDAGDMNSAKEILNELIKVANGNDRLKAEHLLSTIT